MKAIRKSRHAIPHFLEGLSMIFDLEIWPESGVGRVSGYTWSHQA